MVWRTSLARVAPSAIRTAISFCRVVERANIMFATLAHATSRTNPTMIVKSVMICQASGPTMAYRMLKTRDVQPALLVGYACSSPCAMPRISAEASSDPPPGFNRAVTRSVRPSRRAPDASRGSGNQRSMPSKFATSMLGVSTPRMV
jgi:hypothetical protein